MLRPQGWETDDTHTQGDVGVGGGFLMGVGTLGGTGPYGPSNVGRGSRRVSVPD